MLKKKIFVLIFIIFSIFLNYAQNTFSLINRQHKESIEFKLVNNLILLPVELNGKELTFLLDTGVKKSLLFNLSIADSLNLKQLKKVTVIGLGEDVQFEALKSKNNLLRMKDVVCPDFELLVILEKQFDFSVRMGLNIHGIIGSELFKDFIIEVDYNKKKIIFNDPETYKYRKCKKCKTLPLLFYNQKPYVNGTISTYDNKEFNVKLLIDSGGGDSLWLFEKSLDGYIVSNKHFKDILGRGLNGNIFGKKSKLKSFQISDFKFNELIISHPDSSSAIGNNIRYKRNGLIGAEILKRFKIIYDYPHKKITLKKNRNTYNNHFAYNKSGIELIHYGKVLVKEQKSKISFNGNTNDSNNVTEIYSTFTYSFKNAYQISFVKDNSEAANIGIQKDDILTMINGKFAYEYSLQQIIQKLSDKPGKKVSLQVNRNGNFYDYKLKLKDLL